MPLRDKQAVFFDAGFTLLEPAIPVHEAYLNAALQLGIELDQQQFIAHMANEWRQVLRTYRSSHPELYSSDELERKAWWVFTRQVALPFPELLAKHEQWLQILFDHFDSVDAWKLRPGVADLLMTLSELGRVIGIVSNWHSVLHQIIRGHGIQDHFAFVLTSAEVGRKKPHALIFQQAIRLANVPPQAAVHIGDSWDDDVEGARAAGIAPVFLGQTPPEGADPSVPVVACLSELVGHCV